MKLRGILALVLALYCAPALAQVNPGTSPLSGKKGGTNNAFMQFTGPATSMKTFTLPNATGTLAALGQIQTWTGAQSFTDGTLILLGSGSGSSTLKAPATGGGTATLFAGSDTFVGRATTDTLTNKTLTAPAINGGTAQALTTLGIRSTGSAFDIDFAATEVLTANRTLTWVLGDASRSITLAGNVSLGGAFTMSGAFGFTGTLTNTTAVTFPTAGTLATLAGTETLTNKTFVCANQTSCVVRIGSDVSGLGTGVATALANNLNATGGVISPTPTRAGDIAYWNGSNWVTIAGNNAGTLTLQENASGVPVWASVAGTGTVTEQKNTASGGLSTSGNCDNTTSNSASACNYALAFNGAVLNATPANPTVISSNTDVMLGLGVTTCRVALVNSTRMRFEVTGYMFNSASNIGVLSLRFGTGAGPANAAAVTGTTLSSGLQGTSANTAAQVPFAASGIATGLTPGTTYWFDLAVHTNAGTETWNSLTCMANEI